MIGPLRPPLLLPHVRVEGLLEEFAEAHACIIGQGGTPTRTRDGRIRFPDHRGLGTHQRASAAPDNVCPRCRTRGGKSG
jgi:hypothetical protein